MKLPGNCRAEITRPWSEMLSSPVEALPPHFCFLMPLSTEIKSVTNIKINGLYFYGVFLFFFNISHVNRDRTFQFQKVSEQLTSAILT